MEGVGYLVVGGIGLIAVGYSIHRAGLAADRRGWLYYRTKPRFRGSSLGLLEEIYQPSIRYVVDEIAEEKARGDQAETGDKPFG